MLYAEKMAAKIGVENILSCGVISEKRIRMYLKSKEILQNFLDSDGTLEIDRKLIRARPYVTNNKKITISNVPMHVPHDVIHKVIAEHGATAATDIRFLHLTTNKHLRSILSERRTVFITEDTADKLPPSAVIKFEEDQYRIFFNNSKIKCFICHEFGHSTKQCSYNYDNATNTTFDDCPQPTNGAPDNNNCGDEILENSRINTTETLNNDNVPIPDDNNGLAMDAEPSPPDIPKKRPLSIADSATSTQNSDINLNTSSQPHSQTPLALHLKDQNNSTQSPKSKTPKNRKRKSEKKRRIR